MKLLPTLVFVIVAFAATAQPYIDISNNRYFKSNGKTTTDAQKYTLAYYNASVNLPFKLDSNNTIFMVSPYFEEWGVHLQHDSVLTSNYYSIALPLTYIHAFSSRFTVLYSAIPKINYTNIHGNGIGQIGGAVLATFQKKRNLAYKFGIYYNGEFFGNFFMPLAGIDWRINEKNKLFGVLPGSLTYEHAVKRQFYYGATFRAITSSYRKTDKGYCRIDDNQAGVFADVYFSKNFLLNAETGYSILRKVRTGRTLGEMTDWHLDDNFYFKVAIAYRIRLDKAR